MQMTQPKQRAEDLLRGDIASFYDDPYKFVMYVFPWSKKNTVLEKEDGPDIWQKDILDTLSLEIRKREGRAEGEVLSAAIQIAVTSGHGIGKTALNAWIILWFLSTREHPQVIVTANTEAQLKGKTWREVAKWTNLAINKEWFSMGKTKLELKEASDTWFATAVPWSENNPEAFAGTHDKHVLMLFDEASSIAECIYEVAQGALTTDGAMWLLFGNPTQNTGFFRECFRRFKHRWITKQVDSRTARKTNKEQINQWIEDYGENSDFVKVRVRGIFPEASVDQFISADLVERARKLTLPVGVYDKFPIVLGVDISRFGDDESIVVVRQQRKVHDIYRFSKLDNMALASQIETIYKEWNAARIFTDDTGVGGGVTDALRLMRLPVIGVVVGANADDKALYFNKRAEMFGLLLKCLEKDMDLPDDMDMELQLTSFSYKFTGIGQVMLERKAETKKKVGGSPDIADAIAMTFAYPVYEVGSNRRFMKGAVNNNLIALPGGGCRPKKVSDCEVKTIARRKQFYSRGG